MKKTLLLNFLKAATSRNPRKNTTRFNGFLALFLMVMGMEVSLGQVTIASQDFESSPGTPTLTFSNTNGENSTGTNGASGLPASANLFVSGSRGWQSVDTTSTLTFANQSLSGYTNAFIDFRLAGMSVNTSNGIDGADLITATAGNNNTRIGTNAAYPLPAVEPIAQAYLYAVLVLIFATVVIVKLLELLKLEDVDNAIVLTEL